jgi:hypothetical protein
MLMADRPATENNLHRAMNEWLSHWSIELEAKLLLADNVSRNRFSHWGKYVGFCSSLSLFGTAVMLYSFYLAIKKLGVCTCG